MGGLNDDGWMTIECERNSSMCDHNLVRMRILIIILNMDIELGKG